jgi:tRNA G18 (ribose-2'-O)-methylase SpoU/tetratricopeptide (TPR) repeat protein
MCPRGNERAVRSAPLEPAELLERDRELDALRRAVGAARGGEGRLVVVEGPAGIGKSRLLDAAADMGREAGATVLTARGGELERDFPFGVARQLFEHLLAAATEDERAQLLAGSAALAGPLLGQGAPVAREPARGEDPSFASVHGLFWLTANLTAGVPAVLLVDDAHWADAASLRWLSYLARRIAGLPAIVIVGMRPSEPGAAAPLLAGIAAERDAAVLQPAPLSSGAVAEYVRATVGAEAAGAFCAACHTASAGNPLFLHELVGELAAEGVPPTAEAARQVAVIGPASVARTVLLRLARLPEPAAGVAHAVATLGGGASLALVARLAGVDLEAAARTADALAAADILRPGPLLDFVHPVVRASVHGEIPPLRRALQHRRAAELLADAGAEADAVATQLLATDPAADAWVVERLRAAAKLARARGAPDVACRYLERAIAEPPAETVRAEVLLELAWQEVQLTRGAAVEHAEAVLALTDDPRIVTRARFTLGRAMLNAARLAEAVEVFERGLRDAPESERELALMMRADLAAVQLNLPHAPELIERLRDQGEDLAGETPAERLMLAVIAFARAQANDPAATVVPLAERALGGGALLREQSSGSIIFYEVTFALLFADHFDEVERNYAQALEEARARGTVMGFAIASCFRAWAALRRGAVAEAEAEARSSLDVAALHGWQLSHPMALAFLIGALLERGALAEAEAALDEAGMAGEIPDHVIFNLLLFARGCLHIAAGRPAAGVEDVLLAGAREVAVGGTTPAGIPWRSRAAVTLARMGERDEAERLAAEELTLAREVGAPRAIARALRCAGLVRGGEEGLGLLREAVAALDGSPAVLERAYALTDLGAALRRARLRGDRAERPRAGGARRRRSAAAARADRRGRVADGERAPRRADGRRGPDQPRHRRRAVRDAEDRRGPPRPRVPQARHRLAPRPARGARRRGPGVSGVDLSSARKDPGRVVLEGFHAVKHAVRFGAEIERVVVKDRAAVAELAAPLAPDVAGAILECAEVVEGFKALSPRPVPTGVIAVARRPADELPRDGLVVLLEDPRDLSNVGAWGRVAAAPRAGGVITTGDRDPWAPEALRGSAGLHFALPVLRGETPPGRSLLALDPDGEPLDPHAVPPDAVLAFGTERDGLSAELKAAADAVVALPMAAGVSSLNLATSVAATLYALKLA